MSTVYHLIGTPTRVDPNAPAGRTGRHPQIVSTSSDEEFIKQLMTAAVTGGAWTDLKINEEKEE